MNKEYHIKTSWQIFIYATIIAMLGGAYYMYFSATAPEKLRYTCIAAGMVIIAIYLVFYCNRKMVIITPVSIINQGAFWRKELLKTDIKGFEIEKDNLLFTAISKPLNSLSIISYNILANNEEILAFAVEFEDTEQKNYDNALDNLLHDNELGNSPKERQAALAKALKLTKYVNYIGTAVCLWIFVYPYPYKYAIGTGLLFPLVVMALFYQKREIITFNSDKDGDTAYPNLTSALLAPAGGLLMRAIKDWDLLNYVAIVIPALVAAIILSLVFMFILKQANSKTRKSAFTKFHIISFILLYSGSATVVVNCEFDRAAAKAYHTTVLQKRYTTGKGAAHYLTVDKWGPKAEAHEVTVDMNLYNQVEVSQPINMNVEPGLLGIPWFYVSR